MINEKELRERMLKCKKGCRVGVMPINKTKTSLIFYFQNISHSEVISPSATEKEIEAVLERARKALIV